MDNHDAFALLRGLFDVAVAAASPGQCLAPHLERLEPARGRTIVVGAGKAAAAMARTVEEVLGGPPKSMLEGLFVTREKHGLPLSWIECVEARHPVPDERGLAAAGRIVQLLRNLSPDDRVIALISGGGSALLSAPAPGLSLLDKQSVNRALLASGAPIGAMNVVRKHLSAIKGGQLAIAARPARLVGYLISDVPGDDPGVIASGPTVADASTYADALAVLARYRIDPPPAVLNHLREGAAGRIAETPKPGDPRLDHVLTTMVVTPAKALDAAATAASAAGFRPILLGDALEGLSRDLAARHAGLIRDLARRGERIAVISGGETTVEVTGNGSGGRDVEYLLALAIGLDGLADVWSLAADTDGVDGAAEIAGARISPDTLTRAKARGIDAAARLADNDCHGFFQALGDSIVTGPTRTNVNDFRVSLIAPR